MDATWNDLRDASTAKVLDWASKQSWCQAMAECYQDEEWHAEGDVWTHTCMVCEELQQLQEWPTLGVQQQKLLLFTALLHDAAKPRTTKIDPTSGRVTTPKHAVKGEYLARRVLRDLGCDIMTREMIAKLVRYHGRPVFLLERSEPAHEVVRLSWWVENRLLYLFAVADTRGRDTESISRPEENLEYWKVQAEELGCYHGPYPFETDHARLTFFRSSSPNLHYVPHQRSTFQVTMLSGLPGSGKDTWIRKNRTDVPMISLDEIRAELGVAPTENQGQVVQTAQERVKVYLRAKQAFVFNATNLTKQVRSRWLDLLFNYDARIELVYVEPPLSVIKDQNRSRQARVPSRVIQSLAESCDPPTAAEAHRVVYFDGTDTHELTEAN